MTQTSSDTPLFSIIVPTCNVGKYVAKTIQSFREQTFADFEVYMVVEDSKDDTLDVCKREVGDDPRFHIVTLPKSGSCSVPRNYGMDHAVGKYMLFVDGDDWMELDSLERFKQIIDQHPDLDLIVSGMRVYVDYGDGRIEKTEQVISQGTPGTVFENGYEYLNSIDFIHYYNPSACSLVYKGDLLRNDKSLRQAPGRFHQDDEWSYRVVLRAKKTIIADFQYYDYRVNAKSATNIKSSKTIFDRADNAISCCEYFDKGYYPKSFAKTLARYFCQNFFWGIFLRKYMGRFADQLLPRADCYEAIRRCMGTKEQYRLYRKVVKAAGGFYLLGIPLMALGRHKLTFPIAEYSYRIWTNRLLPIFKKLHIA